MKILYLVHQFYPEKYTGTEKFVLQLAQQMQDAGHTVKVITYDAQALPPTQGPSSIGRTVGIKRALLALLRRVRVHPVQLRRVVFWRPQRIISRRYTHEGIDVIAFSHQWLPAFLNHRLNDASLRAFARQLLIQEQPDLLHVGHAMRTAEFVHVAIELQIPYLLTLTDYWLICPRSTLLTESATICAGPQDGQHCRIACPKQVDPTIVRQRSRPAQQLVSQAACVVAPSQFLATKVQATLGQCTLMQIPYGVDNARLPLNTRRYPNTEPLIFMFAGSLVSSKGIHLLVRTFQRLPTPAIRLEIYGSGILAHQLQEQAQGDERISFGGVFDKSQMGTILSRVDVVVIPSLWHENLPLIMQEAQAAGVPTLVSDVGGMTECVTDGVNGFTFRMGDGADLQRKMQMIIDQPELLNEIKENMRNPKPGQYRVTSLEEEATLYLEEYAKLYAQAKG